MSDVHLGVRNNKIQKIFEKNFENYLNKIYTEEKDNENIVFIAGDLFDYPVVKNEVLNAFLKIISKYKDKIKIIISAGNHDSSPIKRDSTLDILSNINMDISPTYENDKYQLYSFESFNEMPTIIVAIGKMKRIIIEKENILIDALPYYMNKEKLSFSKEDRAIFSRDSSYRSFLICHGVTEESNIYSDQDVINKSYLKNRDFILKGHIHEIFEETISGSKVFSAGSLNKNSSKSNGCMIEIYSSSGDTQLNDFSLDELCNEEKNEENKTNQTGSITQKLLHNSEEFSVNYKTFECEREDTINSTLSSLGKNDIVSIHYFGDTEKINGEEYMRCFNECLKFSFIFSDIDLEVGDYAKHNVNSLEFIGFHDFVENTLKKMKKDSNIETIEKIYNKLKA